MLLFINGLGVAQTAIPDAQGLENASIAASSPLVPDADAKIERARGVVFLPGMPFPGTQSPETLFLQRLQQALAAPKTTQDIDPELFRDFWLNWKLITTRYKPDGQELRFIYANSIGAEALAHGIYPFPEGTVFAKIGVAAVQDTIFNSSLVPGRIQRVQIMLKKSQDPKAREGWVYSLFTGKKMDGHMKLEEIEACQACHAVAQSRDMIFSQPFPVLPGMPFISNEPASSLKQYFNKANLADLPLKTRDFVRQHAPKEKKLMYRAMPAFDGTLFESREMLADFAMTDQMTYILGNPLGTNILVAIPTNKTCVHMIGLAAPRGFSDIGKEPVSGVPAPHRIREWDKCADSKPVVTGDK